MVLGAYIWALSNCSMPALREKRKPVKPAVFPPNFALQLRMIYAFQGFQWLRSLHAYFYTFGILSLPDVWCWKKQEGLGVFNKENVLLGCQQIFCSRLLEMSVFYFAVYKAEFFIVLQTEQLNCSWALLGQWLRLDVTVKNFVGLTKVLPEITVSTHREKPFPPQL